MNQLEAVWGWNSFNGPDAVPAHSFQNQPDTGGLSAARITGQLVPSS